jgi:hypothetical protein
MAQCPLLALSGLEPVHCKCLLSGVSGCGFRVAQCPLVTQADIKTLTQHFNEGHRDHIPNVLG